jgi:hypothetical protein
MQHTHAHTRPAALPRALTYGDAFEWDELPALAAALVQRELDPTDSMSDEFDASPWSNTVPAALQAFDPPEPLRETLQGLATREVREPEVFRHYFGSPTPA